MLKKDDDESTVLSAGDSFGFFPDTLWFEIVKPNTKCDEIKELADAASVMETTSKESATDVGKRKLPAWLNGNSSKKRRGGNNDVTGSNDGDDSEATQVNSTETNNTVVEQNMDELAVKPAEESVAKDLPLIGIWSAMDDDADNQVMQSGDDVPSASSGGDIDRAPATESTCAASGSVEPSEQTESPLEPDTNELEMLIDAIEAEAQGSMVVEEDPTEGSNVPNPEPEPNEQIELPNSVLESRNDTINAAQVNPSTSDAENRTETGDEMPLPKIQIKTEPADDAEDTTDAIDGVPLPKVLIKTEPNVNTGAAEAGPSGAVPIEQEIKREVKPEPDSSVDSKVPKRDCCPYGIKCYR